MLGVIIGIAAGLGLELGSVGLVVKLMRNSSNELVAKALVEFEGEILSKTPAILAAAIKEMGEDK
jgi:hypothetical protein